MEHDALEFVCVEIRSIIELFCYFETILEKIERQNCECIRLLATLIVIFQQLIQLSVREFCVREPTRVTQNSATTIELIITNAPEK